jgi:Na+/proline symporter
MIATSGLFTENLYRPLVPHASDRHYLWAARISSLGIVIAGVICAYLLEDVVSGLEIFWKIAAMLGIAFWLGLFWRRMTVAGAWVSTLAASAAWWLSIQGFFIEWVGELPLAAELRFLFVRDGVAEVYLPWQMVFYLTTGLVFGVLASLVTPSVAHERLERFYDLVRTPVIPGEKVDQPCTMPAGATTQPRRKLLPIASLEIYVPRLQMLLGFLAGWVAVALLIGVVLWIVK